MLKEHYSLLCKYFVKITEIVKLNNNSYIKKIHKIIFLLFFILITRNIYANSDMYFNWYWVFYENEKSNNYHSYTFRPFYLKNIKNENNIFTASLMPFVFWEYKDAKRTVWKSFFGFVESVDYTHSNGIKDYDFGVFPFLLYGSSEDPKDQYLHIWPFGGVIKGKLGQDKIKPVLFPGVLLFFLYPPVFPPTWIMTGIFFISLIPLYVEYESRDYKAWGILWPIMQRGKSPIRDDKRVLPFYAHNYKKDNYDNYMFLMIFNYSKIFMKNDEETTFFAFPFYGRRWNTSSIRNSSTLFWPFFSWGYDIKRSDFELNFPWPLVQIQTSVDPKIYKRIFFPLFGIYEYINSETFFLTPFYISLKKHSDNLDSEYYINVLIIWYFKKDFKKKPSHTYGTSWRYFKIWPLFQYEYDDRGNLSFNMLSLFPFRDPEGYEKMYQPFWTLFEYKRLASGEKRFGILLRLYYQRWSDEFLNIKIPVILSFGSSEQANPDLSFLDYFTIFCYNNDNDGKYMSILFSMFSYNNDKDGNYIRLFWIPINIGENLHKQNNAGNYNKKNNKNIIDKEVDDRNPVENEIDFLEKKEFYYSNNINVNRDIVLGKMGVF